MVVMLEVKLGVVPPSPGSDEGKHLLSHTHILHQDHLYCSTWAHMGEGVGLGGRGRMEEMGRGDRGMGKGGGERQRTGYVKGRVAWWRWWGGRGREGGRVGVGGGALRGWSPAIQGWGHS